MDALDEAKQRAAHTYNSASDFYDHPANAFWERYGQRTVARLRLQPGSRVLDVCCGSGASAIPAAAAVGPTGSVLGIDLAERMLQLARKKADRKGHNNVEFRVGDMLDANLGSAQFDAVMCVFGIFQVPDMAHAVRQLWRLVRPGGQLAVTTWGPRFLEPMSTVFWKSVRAERPDLSEGFNAWDRVGTPGALRAILPPATAAVLDVVAESGSHALRSPEDWWPMVLGTGYRGAIEQMDIDARARVQQTCLEFIRANSVRSVETNVVYGRGTKLQGKV